VWRWSLEQRLRKGYPGTALTGDPVYIHPPNPDNIGDAKKCELTGAWYSCLLKGTARAWQIQRRMFEVNHWTENNGGGRERIEGAEGVCNPITTSMFSQKKHITTMEWHPNLLHLLCLLIFFILYLFLVTFKCYSLSLFHTHIPLPHPPHPVSLRVFSPPPNTSCHPALTFSYTGA